MRPGHGTYDEPAQVLAHGALAQHGMSARAASQAVQIHAGVARDEHDAQAAEARVLLQHLRQTISGQDGHHDVDDHPLDVLILDQLWRRSASAAAG
jgi:hypothetical protein